MGKLHEVLAAEKTLTSARDTLLADTAHKFSKPEYFQGHTKSLRMIVDSPENAALEAAARNERAVPTTVLDTLDYMFDVWAKAEDLLATKNLTNTTAVANLEFRGMVIATNLPIDELMGLESRLEKLRNEVLSRMPTLDAARNWTPDATGVNGIWLANDEVTAKTNKTMYPVVMAEATDKHPAQVKEATRDEVVGTFTLRTRSGAATTQQKAEILSRVDDLIAEVKKARQRANNVDAIDLNVGRMIKDVLLRSFD